MFPISRPVASEQSEGCMESEVKIKQIVLNRMERCVVCHHEFHTDDIHVISRKPEMWTMLVECTDCHARNFVAAVLNDGDPEEAQLALRKLTEKTVKNLLEPDQAGVELETPPAGDPISPGDVVDMYQFLGEFDGDFKALFRSAS